jgi:hypothetical protein
MSELAFDKEGNPFRFSRRTKKLRPRRWKNAGQRGTCAAVLDADGEPLFIDADAEYAEFRAAVGNVSGFYRLDQCDEDGATIEDTPPAYVSIESTRNTTPAGEVDSRDALIRDLAQINAEMTRTIVERFSNVMQAAADVLRAADGAGLPRREPLPPVPVPNKGDDGEDDDEDDDEAEEGEPQGGKPSERVWAMVEPMLPAIGAWIASMVAKRVSSQPPAVTPSPAPAPAPAPEAAPSAAPTPGGVAAAPSTPAPAAPAPSTPAPAAPAPSGPAPAAAAPGAPEQAASTLEPSAAAVSPTIPTATPAAAAAASARPPAAAAGGPDSTAPSATATGGAAPADTTQLDSPRNALPAGEPTPEQWAHLLAIRAQLSPREAAIAETVVMRMAPEMRVQWLAELSLLGVDGAAEVVRSMIPKPPHGKNGPKGDSKDGR